MDVIHISRDGWSESHCFHALCHLARSEASSFFKPIFPIPFSTCPVYVLNGRSFFLLLYQPLHIVFNFNIILWSVSFYDLFLVSFFPHLLLVIARLCCDSPGITFTSLRYFLPFFCQSIQSHSQPSHQCFVYPTVCMPFHHKIAVFLQLVFNFAVHMHIILSSQRPQTLGNIMLLSLCCFFFELPQPFYIILPLLRFQPIQLQNHLPTLTCIFFR